MKNKLLPFLFIFFLVSGIHLLSTPGFSESAEIQTLEIDFFFTAPDYPDKQLLGYILYRESEQVCQTNDPDASTITCDILTEDGTFNFTLTGYYSDNTESPPSPSFPFTIDSTSAVPPSPPTLTVESTKSVDEDGTTTITFTAADSDGTIAETTAIAGHGTVSVNDNNTISYSPDSDYNGPDTISVTTKDDDGMTATATSAITVNDINDPPTLTVESTKSVDEDSSTTITFTAADPDGTIAETTASAEHGSVTVNDNNTITYSPDSDYNGPDTISVTTKDDDGMTATATSAITVNEIIVPPADPPTDPATPVLHTLEIEFSFTAPDYPDKNLYGYRLYKEEIRVCETADPDATMFTCDILTEDGTFNFTLTGYYTDGTESPPSPSFPFTIDSTSITQPDPDPLLAVINPTPSSGEVPLNVSFAGTGSTGNIAMYYWEFGDGTSSTGSVASRTYSTPGTYTATLRVEDESGTTNLATTIITALQDTTPPEPPTAILSSTTAAGDAPLPVTFSGSSSTTPNPPIVSYRWTFGDGSQASGETTSHTYSTAGTYHTELTVTDSLGLSDKVDTPVVVLVSVTPNEKPVAILSADPTEGDAPLLVTFDGSQSSDPDGSIARYDWNFGDGATATGPTATHTYSDAAIYTMSLQITDDLGETATVTREIICNIPPPENILNFEVGEISIDHQWVTVLFENSFIQPIVIAGPPSTTDIEQVLVRIRNINQDGFEIRLQEWDYLDDIHDTETFNYIVMEDGMHTLDSGLKIEAGSFTAATRFQKVSLQQSYTTTPVILTQVITENEADAVTGRLQNTSQTIFEYKLQEQETTKSKHSTETVGYIAWEPGKGEIQGLLFETGITPESVTSNWFDLAFQTVFPDPPLFIANMQTYEGRDTAAMRTQNITQTGTQIKSEEEQSKDTETDHPAEVTGYLVIGDATAPAE